MEYDVKVAEQEEPIARFVVDTSQAEESLDHVRDVVEDFHDAWLPLAEKRIPSRGTE